MNATPASADRARGGSVALDVFRGLAAVLMIFNHAGFAWLEDAAWTGWQSHLVALGSHAPVLFFFATGVGLGLSPGRLKRPGVALELAWKCLLLVVADQLLFLRDGTLPGLDFFGFIALSMVVVSLVDATRNAPRNALIVVGVVLAVRYGVVPMFKDALLESSPWVAFVLGTRGVENISYPIAPWIVYPLLGYWLARRGWFASNTMTSADPTPARRRVLIVAAGIAVVMAASLVLYVAGKPFYRWGTVNMPFFILSVGVVASVVLLAEAIASRAGGVAEVLSLRGAAAFLVVPVHYALIHLSVMAEPAPWAPAVYVPAALLAVSISFALSKVLARGLARLPQRALVPLLIGLAACVAVVALRLLPSRDALSLLVLLGQVLAAAMLTMRPGRKAALPAGCVTPTLG